MRQKVTKTANRVLIASPVHLSGSGGLETHYRELIAYLTRHGLSIIVICPRSVASPGALTSFEAQMRRGEVDFLCVPMKAPNLYEEDSGSLSMALLAVRVVVYWFMSVICCTYAVNKYRPKTCLIRHSVLSVPLVILLSSLRIRVVGDGDALSSSGMYVFFKGRSKATGAGSTSSYRFILLRFVLERMDRITMKCYSHFRVISESLVEDLTERDLIAAEKITLIPPGIDTSRIPVSVLDSTDLAYFGVLEEFEGLKILLEAFKKVHLDYPLVKLHIFGSGPIREELELMVSEMGIGSSVLFYGWVSREKLLSLFDRFGITVFPRLNGYGHVPMKILEALSAGKVVIASDVRGISDVFQVGEVIIVEKGNGLLLAEAIERVICDSQLRKEVSRLGRLKANSFDSSRVYPDLLNLL